MASISSVFNKLNFIFLALLLVLIMAGELILEPMHLATWPAFMVMIFFFMAHMNIKEAPSILLGSAFGMFNLILIVYWFDVTVPLFGGDMAKYTDPHTVEAMFQSKLIYVALFVAAIVFLKDIIPWVFNNYAFMCFTVAAAVSGGNTAAAVAAKTVAGYANGVVAAGGNPAAIAAMKGATDKAIAATVPVTNVYQWIAIELIGGAIFIVGIYGITKLLAKLAGAPAPANTDIKG
ncbi:hypothetical protein [Desulfosporosinus metallidurans]|uniref:Uncharacterized protein n=1 Tax=Desulfosporosinus metallidurans TaxID=1888891 RepID=A0A1Q8QUE6_9FIRM|nr:hypothetical protein [Desulfosporosinus metallidurans]OLN30971.1 hypothetical protein DSOL_2858 [Desulfosporosinus metallidurans]